MNLSSISNPNQSFGTSYGEPLHEPIDVSADFLNPHLHQRRHGPPCIPKYFTTKTGREISITEIGLIHPKYDGLRANWAFDVTDGGSDYRIVLNSESLQWWLEWEGDNL